MADKKHGKVTKQLFDEIYDVYAEYPEGSTKKALLAGLLDLVDKAESDEEAQNIVWANKDLPLQMLTVDELQMMPSVSKTFTNGPSNRKVNKEEAFGEDWVNRYEQIPYNEIALVAEQQGKNPKELVAEMGAEALDKRRKAIARGEDEGSWIDSPNAFVKNLGGAIMHTFAPRVQEAIERGEDPSAKDYALDQAQNLLYAVPYGTTLRAIRNPATRTVAEALLSNAGAPIATEALDEAYYTDPNNPRSEFSGFDVATGTGTNLVGGALLRGAGMGIGRIAPKVRDFLGELATGKTAKDAVDEVRKQYKFNVNVANDPTVPAAARQKAQEMVKLMESDPTLYNAVASKEPMVFKVAEQDGSTLADKANAYIKENKLDANTVLSAEGKGHFLPVKDKFINRTSKYSPVSASLTKAYDKLGLGTATEGLKTADQLAREEAVKNFITNEYGNAMYEQGRALNRFPLVGPAIQKMLEEDAKKKAEHEENMRILDELRARGLLHSER